MAESKPTIRVPKISERDFERSLFLRGGNPLYFIFDHSFGSASLRRGNEIIIVHNDQLTYATVVGSARKQGPYTVIGVDWMGKKMDVFVFNIVAVIVK